jgi:hypothetical protein
MDHVQRSVHRTHRRSFARNSHRSGDELDRSDGNRDGHGYNRRAVARQGDNLSENRLRRDETNTPVHRYRSELDESQRDLESERSGKRKFHHRHDYNGRPVHGSRRSAVAEFSNRDRRQRGRHIRVRQRNGDNYKTALSYFSSSSGRYQILRNLIVVTGAPLKPLWSCNISGAAPQP